MISWIRKKLSKQDAVESFNWITESSIFNYIVNNLNEEGKIKDSFGDLPDEKHIDENSKDIRFAPGLFDAMFGAQESDISKSEVEELAKLLSNIAKHGDKDSESKFYQSITLKSNAITIIDDFLEKVVKLSLPIEPYLLNFSKDLAFKTNHRNSVKFGLAILGICQNKSVIKEIKILGSHDEFTVFAMVAIMNISDEIINDLWELSKKVDGWGKIQVVNRLVKMDISSEIKDWLIIDGYKNNIMYEELAFICAVNGELYIKLESKTINRSLFVATSEIIQALITGGPAEDISSYPYAAIAIENFVRHAKKHAEDISSFIILNQIKDFLIGLQNDISKHAKNGWTVDIISNCLIDIIEIINSKDWSVLAMTNLESSNNIDYWKGKQAAKILDIDIWEIVWQRLKNNPSEGSLWYDVVHEAKSEQANQIIEFAIQTIPLKKLATGPKDALGLGREFLQYQSLDFIITFLENYPQKGEPIILTALNSPVTRNRNMAIKVLHRWGKDNWSEDINKQLLRLKAIEPNQSTKENINRLLAGKNLTY